MSGISHERFESIMAGQKMQARKIYDAIPKVDAWTVSQIAAEVNRIHSCGAGYNVVEAVLNNLADAKLVSRIPTGRFRALPVKPKKQSQSTTNEAKEEVMSQQATVQAPAVAAPAPAAPAAAAKPAIVQPPSIDRLLHLADALNTTGKLLQQMSVDLTDVADSITRASEADQANLQRLRQLQDLLRGIGMSSAA